MGGISRKSRLYKLWGEMMMGGGGESIAPAAAAAAGSFNFTEEIQNDAKKDP